MWAVASRAPRRDDKSRALHAGDDLALRLHRSRVPIIAISQSQRRTAPNLPIAAVIHHGVDVRDFPMGGGDGGYLLFLGRMSPDKGVHRAIDVARAAQRPLPIAAKMWEPDERRYSHKRSSRDSAMTSCTSALWVVAARSTSSRGRSRW